MGHSFVSVFARMAASSVLTRWFRTSRIGAAAKAIGEKVRTDKRVQRALAVGGVAATHAVLIFGFLSAVAPAPPARTEINLSIGGTPGEPTATPAPPALAEPDVPDIAAPQFDTIVGLTAPSVLPERGSSDVTRPAIAMADAHAFPMLPAGHVAGGIARLLLSIGPDGSVLAATIAHSSGDSALDVLAVDWVMAHWRYEPALRNGEPMATTTLAIIAFANG